MRAINPNVFPKDGYMFRDPDGSKHVADSWAGVIARVKRYRKRQGRPEAGVDDEVIAQACQKYPLICSEVNPANTEQLRRVSLKSRVLLWLGKIREQREKTPLVFVSDELHAARVDVCSRCPKQAGLPDGCGSCRQALRELAGDIVGRRNLDGRVAACSVIGEYIPVSSWIEDIALPNPDLHWECWRKRSL